MTLSSRRPGQLALLACAALFALAAGYALGAAPNPGWFSDSLDYLLLADFFRGHFTGLPSVLGTELFGTSRFPPLFPLQLALSGVGLDTPERARLVVLATACLMLLVASVWLRKATGSALLAACVLAGSLLTPRYFLFLLELQSEFLYLLLLMGSLYLAQRYREGRCSLLLLCAVASLLPLARMAGLAMLAGLALWLLLTAPRSELRRRLLACVALGLPAALWLGYRRMLPIELDYLQDLGPAQGGVPGQLAAIVSAAPARLLGSVVNQFSTAPGPQVWLAVGLILLAALAGWWQRLGQREVDALMLPLGIGLTLVWPYPAEDARLMAVLMPMLMLSAWAGLRMGCAALPALARRAAPAHAAGALLFGLILLATASTWTVFVARASTPVAPELASGKRALVYFTAPERGAAVSLELMLRLRFLAADVPQRVPREDCVWSAMPALSAYYGGFETRFRRLPRGLAAGPESRARLAGCRYVLVSYLNTGEDFGPLYPAPEIRTFSKPLLVSSMDWNGQDTVAAALFQLLPDAGQAQPPARRAP